MVVHLDNLLITYSVLLSEALPAPKIQTHHFLHHLGFHWPNLEFEMLLQSSHLHSYVLLSDFLIPNLTVLLFDHDKSILSSYEVLKIHFLLGYILILSALRLICCNYLQWIPKFQLLMPGPLMSFYLSCRNLA